MDDLVSLGPNGTSFLDKFPMLINSIDPREFQVLRKCIQSHCNAEPPPIFGKVSRGNKGLNTVNVNCITLCLTCFPYPASFKSQRIALANLVARLRKGTTCDIAFLFGDGTRTLGPGHVSNLTDYINL